MEEQFKIIASLIGEPVRATMLWNLLDGKAFTATELAIDAGASPQSASMHLTKLVEAGLLIVEKQGRHRYYRFSRPDVAYAIEAMANLIPGGNTKPENHNIYTDGVRYCRTCYDHLAGKVGVVITEQMMKQKIIVPEGKQYRVTSKGNKWFEDMGILIAGLRSQRRVLTLQCLDWSERRHHLAGSLGAALLETWMKSGWLRRVKNSRAVIVTAKGQEKFYEMLRVEV